MADPYVYPGTETLKNHFNIRDPDELEAVERNITSLRLKDRAAVPTSVKLTSDGYADLHKFIFGDLYPWAGQFRTVAIAKPNAMFCMPQFIEPQLADCFANIASDQRLATTEYKLFAEGLAEHLSQLDAIHPFREGNGRTMRLFLQTFCQERQIPFRTKYIERDAWMNASITSFQSGNTNVMSELLHSTIERSAFQRKLEQRHTPKRDMGHERE